MMPALEYPMDKIEPPRLAVFLNHCAATCEWWYVIECRVNNISRSDDEDDILEQLERYFDQFSSGPREMARDELERFSAPTNTVRRPVSSWIVDETSDRPSCSRICV